MLSFQNQWHVTLVTTLYNINLQGRISGRQLFFGQNGRQLTGRHLFFSKKKLDDM